MYGHTVLEKNWAWMIYHDFISCNSSCAKCFLEKKFFVRILSDPVYKIISCSSSEFLTSICYFSDIFGQLAGKKISIFEVCFSFFLSTKRKGRKKNIPNNNIKVQKGPFSKQFSNHKLLCP